jgi:hypothetical protein
MLLERDLERGVLARLLADVRSGGSRALVVWGKPASARRRCWSGCSGRPPTTGSSAVPAWKRSRSWPSPRCSRSASRCSRTRDVFPRHSRRADPQGGAPRLPRSGLVRGRGAALDLARHDDGGGPHGRRRLDHAGEPLRPDRPRSPVSPRPVPRRSPGTPSPRRSTPRRRPLPARERWRSGGRTRAGFPGPQPGSSSQSSGEPMEWSVS